MAAGTKWSWDQVSMEDSSNVSPFMPMFEIFRSELDKHHDRRERIIKASRDITALSKNMWAWLRHSAFYYAYGALRYSLYSDTYQ